MALVEPLIGHLLSKYKETVLEGLSKIRNTVQAGGEHGDALATALTQREDAMNAIRATLMKTDYTVPVFQTLTVLLSHLPERGGRVALIREVLRGDVGGFVRKTLATVSDISLPYVSAALLFLTAAVKDAPLLVLARLRGPADVAGLSTAAPTPSQRADVPLHLGAFRLQLTYGQRRLRLVRLGFLVQLITSSMHNAASQTLCSHGVLTHLVEDAAELLREGTQAGVACALEALRVVREGFVQSRDSTAAVKRQVLLAQRNVFRLLVRALEYEPVADHAAAILYAIVDETIESPADYASTRVEALEDHGMPNFLLFFLLRLLRPKSNERMSRLVLHVLQRAPDLIRPYFTRVSGHLAEEGGAQGVAPTTARVAVLGHLTRVLLLPMPYHLSTLQVRLEAVPAKVSTFYTMSPRDVADEICPAWVAEYVHRLINSSTNLLMLTLAMQLTEAALLRARRVLPFILAAQRASDARRANATTATQRETEKKQVGASNPNGFSAADQAALQGSEDAAVEAWDAYNAQVRHHLQAALPSREEFWHRMTQQVHQALSVSLTTDAVLVKTHMVTQRMLMLMCGFVEVFDVRVPWLSAVPSFLPDLKRVVAVSPANGAARSTASSPTHPITLALQQHNDILRPWPAASVALLCELLTSSLQRRVPMVKLHHLNMSQTQGVGEWPLLLSVLLWVTHHAHTGSDAEAATMHAVGWAAQLLLWTVHSVTIHSTCTLAEAHLWLVTLTPNTVPVFLHVLNQLLMRSLSKAADRVTRELREAPHGILVTGAQYFIERTRGKQPPAAAESKGIKKTGSEHSGTDLWGTHLHAAVDEFEGVLNRVAQRWPQREALLSAANTIVQEEHRVAAVVTQRQCIDVVVLADRQRGLLTASGPRGAVAMTGSAVEQLKAFVRTLRSPVLPLPEEEAELLLLSQLHRTTSKASKSVEKDGCGLARVRSVLQLSGFPPSPTQPRWYAMSSVCWHLAGRLLEEEESQSASAARQTAVQLVRAVLARKEDVLSVLQSHRSRDGVHTGFLVLLLVCARVLLSLPAVETPESLCAEECAALGELCVSVYTGTLVTQDRVCYAVCLSLHYLSSSAASAEGEGPWVYDGATVPTALVQHRFLLAGHSAGTLRTSEVEMLSWHVDTLTEDDVTQMALRVSSRLHNGLVRKSNATQAKSMLTTAEDILCAVYPELDGAADLEVADMTVLTSSDVLDLRYLVPLLQRVTALPSALLAHLSTGRMIAVLLKALTCVDSALRTMAATTLATMYVPKGALRIVVSVARMKLRELSEKKMPPAAVLNSQERLNALPRLPTPLAAFLILAIRPLGRYDDALHHHLIHFLVRTRQALDTVIPFTYWATAPPLTAISVPLMLETQEAVQLRSRKAGTDNVAQTSAADVAQELRRGIPPQLRFLLRLLRHACEVPQDGTALLSSGGLCGLTLLCDLLTASDAQRVMYLRCLVEVCTKSSSLTRLFAHDGRLLLWCDAFLSELCREYGTASAYPYSGASFTTALALLQVLCTSLLEASADAVSTAVATARLSGLSVSQLRQRLCGLRVALSVAHVTARDVLDALDGVIEMCAAAEQGHVLTGKRSREEEEKEMVLDAPLVKNVSAKKRAKAEVSV